MTPKSKLGLAILLAALAFTADSQISGGAASGSVTGISVVGATFNVNYWCQS